MIQTVQSFMLMENMAVILKLPIAILTENLTQSLNILMEKNWINTIYQN